ncbi:MAG TPA: hypothetical protein V6D25_31420 [Leptolyngbyaceae cyanobacterium]
MAQKIIYGTVNEDGSKQSGEGFEVKAVDVGNYLITVSEPFASSPSVVATLKDWGADNQIIVKDITNQQFQIAIWDLGIKQQSGSTATEIAVTKEKSAFNFIAIGEAG